MTRKRGRGKTIGAALLGSVVGYIAYLPALGIVLFLTYGRVDGEMFFYGLYLPLQLPFLLDADFRETLRGEELLLLLFGVALMVLGAFIGVKMRNRRQKAAETKHA